MMSAAALSLPILLAQPRAVAPQSALDTGGPAAARIGDLWNVMLVVGTVVTAATLALLLYALLRRRGPGELPPEADRAPDPRGEQANDESGGRGRPQDAGLPKGERQGARWMVYGGVVFPAVVLGALLIVTLRTLGAVVVPSHAGGLVEGAPGPGELVIEVTGRQYWWEVRYLDSSPGNVFETANEIRVPVGRAALIRLRSDDVIHSLWVPALQGKMDLVPGRTNVLRLAADRAGVWRGQCAEFCGVQHAKMAIVVVAEPAERWTAWLAAQRAPAAEPVDSGARADRERFLTSGCALCHTVRGTSAGGGAGPDLTHVSSRLTLAAGTLPNNLGNLHGWIADPQGHKPGSKMPALPLTSADLHGIARYLATLR